MNIKWGFNEDSIKTICYVIIEWKWSKETTPEVTNFSHTIIISTQWEHCDCFFRQPYTLQQIFEIIRIWFLTVFSHSKEVQWAIVKIKSCLTRRTSNDWPSPSDVSFLDLWLRSTHTTTDQEMSGILRSHQR